MTPRSERLAAAKEKYDSLEKLARNAMWADRIHREAKLALMELRAIEAEPEEGS